MPDLADPTFVGCGGKSPDPLFGNRTGTRAFDPRGESVSFSGQGKVTPGDFGEFEYSGALTLRAIEP